MVTNIIIDMENTYALDNQCKEMKNVSSSEDLKLLTTLNGQYGLFRLFQDFLYIYFSQNI